SIGSDLATAVLGQRLVGRSYSLHQGLDGRENHQVLSESGPPPEIIRRSKTRRKLIMAIKRNSLCEIFQRPTPSIGSHITSDDTNTMKPITYQSHKSFSPCCSSPFPGF